MSRSRNSCRGKRGSTRWGCPSDNCDWCASSEKRRAMPLIEQREIAAAVVTNDERWYEQRGFLEIDDAAS
jgi:hypothetical protein